MTRRGGATPGAEDIDCATATSQTSDSPGQRPDDTVSARPRADLADTGGHRHRL